MVQSMQKRVAWAVSLLLVGALAAGYYAWRALTVPDIALPVEPAIEPSSSTAVQHPAIHHPIERIAVAAEPKSTLPQLDASDPEIQDALARLIGRIAFAEFVQPGELIRHVVATVDNLPRKTLAPRLSPVKPVPGAFLAAAGGTQATLASADASRYSPYLMAFEALDTQKLVAIYAYFYPLFQQAYRELGYPNGYFNDRLVEAIDVMLATPELTPPVQLAQPRVLYQFADPDLEALPSGQKIMLRIGADNASRVREKLVDLRLALTGQHALPPDLNTPQDAASAPSAPARSSTTTSGG